MIHATHGTPPERAGNATVDVIAHDGATPSVTLEVDELGNPEGYAEATLALAEAEAVAAALVAAVAEARAQ